MMMPRPDRVVANRLGAPCRAAKKHRLAGLTVYHQMHLRACLLKRKQLSQGSALTTSTANGNSEHTHPP
jgi:hypothetical protein